MTGVEPVEIVAGQWQLRPWPSAHADLAEFLTEAWHDPAARAGRTFRGATVAESVEQMSQRRLLGWERGDYLAWSIREPTTGRCVGEIAVANHDDWHRCAGLAYLMRPGDRGRGVMTTCAVVVSRWAFGALGVRRIQLDHAVGNLASGRVASKAGFTREGLLRSAFVLDGVSHDLTVWSLLATDPQDGEQRGVGGRR